MDDLVSLQVTNAVEDSATDFTWMYVPVAQINVLKLATHTSSFVSAAYVSLLLHCGVGQLLSVNDQVSVVRGFQCEASVTDAAAVASLLVLLHDVLQVLSPLCKGQLETQQQEACM